MNRLIFIVLFFAFQVNSWAQSGYGQPNVIFIMADDMGYGDPTCYNPESKIPTPFMDQLAKEGLKFTDAHSASSVCTPSRYSIITGNYAWRSDLKREVLWSTYNDPLIDQSATTIADLFKSEGYATAAIGKWHLGINFLKKQGFRFVEAKDFHEKALQGTRDVNFMNPTYGGPNDLGFDYFFGSGAGHNMEPHVFIENRYTYGLPTIWREKGQPTQEGISASEVHEGWMIEGWDDTAIGPTLTEKSLDFIEKNAKADQPFFLYLPAVAPHRPCTPPGFIKGKSQAGERGDMVAEFDWMVGQVMQKLDELGIRENTMLMVSNDNGATRVSDDGQDYGHKSCGPLKGFKASLTEGGHRVPFIVSWPATIRPGTESDELVSLMDLYATCAEILDAPAPEGDGISFLHLLTRPDLRSRRTRMVHHTYSGHYALRDGPWKFIPSRSAKDGSWSYQLYNLDHDPYEKTNLAERHPEKIEALKEVLEEMIRM